MNNITDQFNKNGFCIVRNFLDKDTCSRLTEHFFRMHEKGLTFHDRLCPMSDSIYNDYTLQRLLVLSKSRIEKHVNKSLLPTFSYARIHRHGHDMKKHIDRHACEISMTLTLGYESDTVWPIYFDEDKKVCIELTVGDTVIYKGCEIFHWRETFKGKWHAQATLHYVDANGQYKHLVKDRKRD